MKWHFPLMKYTHIRNKTNKIEDQIASVKRELAEVEEATTTVHKAEEIIDLLHSAETLARKFFQQNPDLSFKQMRADVIRKNKKRGYYV